MIIPIMSPPPPYIVNNTVLTYLFDKKMSIPIFPLLLFTSCFSRGYFLTCRDKSQPGKQLHHRNVTVIMSQQWHQDVNLEKRDSI